MTNRLRLPYNIQFFGEGDTPPAPTVQPPGGQSNPPAVPTPGPTVVQQAPIDYDKLSQIIAGKQDVTEESVLKGYFKNQGLSKEEIEQAIGTFKTQKAANQPDVKALELKVETAVKEAAAEKTKNAAIMMSEELGIELKNIEPVLKLADLSDTTDKNGAVDKEKLKAALNKVLEDVPVFKTAGQDSKKPQFVRGTQGAHHPTPETTEAAYLNQKYKNNPYYKGIGGDTK